MDLLDEDYALFSEYYNINTTGYWEDEKYVFIKTTDDQSFAQKFGLDQDTLVSRVDAWMDTLKNARLNRPAPAVDDKILSSWNALMVSALCDAYKAFKDEKYLSEAVSIADFINQNQLFESGEVMRTYKNGEATISGFAEDYATLIEAFINLYQVTLESKWLESAKKLMDYTIRNFLNQENQMFFFTSKSSTELIARKMEVYDNVIPSSNSILAKSLFVLGRYYYNEDYIELSSQMLSNVLRDIEKSPISFTNWLDLYVSQSNPFYEMAVSGSESGQLVKAIQGNYLPNVILAGSTSEVNIPLLKNKYNDGDTFIYVCVNGTCKLPVTEVDLALKQINK